MVLPNTTPQAGLLLPAFSSGVTWGYREVSAATPWGITAHI